MNKTIRFKQSSGEPDDPLLDRMRAAARREGWTGQAGLKEWARINYNAQLRFGVVGLCTSIRFRDERDLVRFWLTI